MSLRRESSVFVFEYDDYTVIDAFALHDYVSRDVFLCGRIHTRCRVDADLMCYARQFALEGPR